jgi:hypothetical protein
MCVLHHCDNPSCVNPAHLFLGTVADNNRDCIEKGRARWARGDLSASRLHPETRPRGEGSCAAKLTAEQVMAMRDAYAAGTATVADLARRFGVAHRTARYAILGWSWAHVPVAVVPHG